MCRRAWRFFFIKNTSSVAKPSARAGVEQPPMHILVVVANIQVRFLKAEGGERFHGNSSWPWVNRSLDIGETRFQIRKCALKSYFFFIYRVCQLANTGKNLSFFLFCWGDNIHNK